ncbi:MAG: Asp23/Gls24 family envelope stress response protein [Candidatus Omnitrophica bacterium]|nr:Asp23/Gls24 family envelope stress response protein [Candidatus Omnitrophota bacterium]
MSRRADLGAVFIRDDVVGSIAALAAQEVMGVSGIWEGVVPWKRYFGKSAVQVELQDQEARLWLNLVVDYGVSLPEVGTEVQDRVREMVERMTGLTVSEVNVSIHHVKPRRSEPK